MKIKLNKRILLLMMLALCLLSGGVCGCSDGEDEVMKLSNGDGEGAIVVADAEAEVEVETEAENAMEKPPTIFVYVCGYVCKPGVYELAEGSRLYEAINSAGGFKSSADENSLNQASVLVDGQQIYVPKKGEQAVNGSGSGGNMGGNTNANSATAKSLININTADEATLCTITGIGASRAADIVAYRQANGPFKSVDDIMKVSGIKDGLFAKIKDQITI